MQKMYSKTCTLKRCAENLPRIFGHSVTKTAARLTQSRIAGLVFKIHSVAANAQRPEGYKLGKLKGEMSSKNFSKSFHSMDLLFIQQFCQPLDFSWP